MSKEGSFKYLVRIANTDLDGNKKVAFALRKVKGVNHMFANLVLSLSGINPDKKSGNLNEEEIKRLEEVIYEPLKFGAPEWMMNRRKDMETGETKHILTNDLRFIKENDIKTMRRIKSYRGMRHSYGLPVRGQRTKSNFRRTKGRGKNSALGVQRKKK